MAATAKLWTAAGDGVRLRVRLTPKSSRDEIDAITDVAGPCGAWLRHDGPALRARVRAVPEDGKANAAVAALVAGWIGVPKGTVAVVAGQKSRVKTLSITGDAAELGQRIDTAVASLTRSEKQKRA